MKIKTGARILALSALTTMMFSASALAKIEEKSRCPLPVRRPAGQRTRSQFC